MVTLVPVLKDMYLVTGYWTLVPYFQPLEAGTAHVEDGSGGGRLHAHPAHRLPLFGRARIRRGVSQQWRRSSAHSRHHHPRPDHYRFTDAEDVGRRADRRH